MPTTWKILINTFDRATRGSYTAAAKLGAYTDATLSAQLSTAGIGLLYNAYHPVLAAYLQQQAHWMAAVGRRQGKVLALKLMKKELSARIKTWAYAIEGVHERGSGGYTALLPRGRDAFRNGKLTERLGALSALELSLRGEPLLASTHADVLTFMAEIGHEEMVESGAKGAAHLDSKEVEAARKALCIALYAVLGGLMNLYAAEPKRIKAFFDLQTLRKYY